MSEVQNGKSENGWRILAFRALAAFSLASFFSPGSPGDFLSDPWIKWDAGSGRFFAGILDVSLGGEIMAISQTSDPAGSWFLYRIQYPSTAGGREKPEYGNRSRHSNRELLPL